LKLAYFSKFEEDIFEFLKLPLMITKSERKELQLPDRIVNYQDLFEEFKKLQSKQKKDLGDYNPSYPTDHVDNDQGE